MISWLVSLTDWHPSKSKALSHIELHHGSALIFAMHLNIMHRYTTFILKRFSFEKYFIAIQENKVNIISMQPWMAAIISKEESIVNKYDMSSIKIAYCSGSPSSKNLCQIFFKRFNIPLINMFGMTETMLPFETDFERSSEG